VADSCEHSIEGLHSINGKQFLYLLSILLVSQEVRYSVELLKICFT
jgi:hypothetical protein